MTALSKRIQKQALRLVYWQIYGIAICSLLIWGFLNVLYSFSILVGGMIYAIPNLFFVFFVFRYASAKEMVKFISAFMFGEIIKLILCGFLFLVIVKYLPISLLSLLIGLTIAMVSFWISCIWQFSKQQPI